MAGATSLGAILGAALAPLTGRLADRIGSRLLLAIGGIIVALACLYLSLDQTLLGFAVGPLVSGMVYDATGSHQQAFVYFAARALRRPSPREPA